MNQARRLQVCAEATAELKAKLLEREEKLADVCGRVKSKQKSDFWVRKGYSFAAYDTNQG